jgi:hypothetical protein
MPTICQAVARALVFSWWASQLSWVEPSMVADGSCHAPSRNAFSAASGSAARNAAPMSACLVRPSSRDSVRYSVASVPIG